MVSRLDRLFVLLDTGSNDSIRLAAAKQLGEVQRIQPSDLNYLLRRIREYSGKAVWETRVAAGHATRCVLENIGSWTPTTVDHVATTEPDDSSRTQKLIEINADTARAFREFDIQKIVASYPALLSLDINDEKDSELASPSNSATTSRGRKRKGSNYRGSTNKNDKEQLLRQRKLINKELGIVDSLNIGIKSTDIVSNDDLQTDYNSSDLIAMPSSNYRAYLHESTSNYEQLMNVLSKAGCITGTDSADLPAKNSSQTIETRLNQCEVYWPISDITKQYTEDLFNPSWEIRHGAAIALREIVRIYGKRAGKVLGLSDASNYLLNQVWLVDMALKALSVLVLDKFGDFLFDQVVAPVRENAAQLLGCCVANMSDTNASLTIELTLKMLEHANWETRHGGILGLKYSLSAVDEPLTKRMLRKCFEPIFKCLGDPVDDVSAEAAASLVPVKDLMIETIPEKAPQLIKFLWEHLADLDELTTSTSNIVLLLASLITLSSAQLQPNELTKSIPRLWSLLGHSSTSVRISILRALQTLISPQKATCAFWMPEDLLTTALRLIFQRSVVENVEEVRPYLEQVWMELIKLDFKSSHISAEQLNLLKATSRYLNYWLCLIMQPSNLPIDRGNTMWLNIATDGTTSTGKPDGEIYVGSSTFNAETLNQQKLEVTKCRLLGAKLIGALYANLVADSDGSSSIDAQQPKETLKYLAEMFIHYMKTKSANQRIISGWTIESWACAYAILMDKDYQKLKDVLPKNLSDQLELALQETSLCYDELASTFTRLQQETRDFVIAIRANNIDLSLPTPSDKRVIYNLHQIQMLCELDLDAEATRASSKRVQNTSKKRTDDGIGANAALSLLLAKQSNLIKSLRLTNLSQKTLSTSVLSSLACAHISWRIIPERLKLLTDPLLDSIDIEEEQPLQDKSINHLVQLFDILCQDLDRNGDLVDNITERLISIISCRALALNSEFCDTSTGTNSDELKVSKESGHDVHKIILLDDLQRKAELNRSTSRRQSSVNSNLAMKRTHSIASSLEIDGDTTPREEATYSPSNPNTEFSEIKVRGASAILGRLVSHFSGDFPHKLPKYWKCITSDIKVQVALHKKFETSADREKNEHALIKSLRLLRVVGEHLCDELRGNLLDLFGDLILLLTSSNPVIRHHSSQCIGMISKLMQTGTRELIRTKIMPMLETPSDTLARCGSIEAVAFIIEHLQLSLVPQINMFIIHVLRRMSDQNDQVRLMAAHCFAKLLSLMPLNLENKSDAADASVEEDKVESIKQCDQRFIEQLLDPKKLDNFHVPFEMGAELRSYQQDGLNWLAFLSRFNLHGMLCDEMGLGKTFMTICMVASDHFASNLNCAKQQGNPNCLPSLIVCPSTLTEHWLYEIDKFLPSKVKKILNPVAYSGNLADRMTLKCQILFAINGSKNCSSNASDGSAINLVVTSYDIVRNDIEFFKGVQWNYCVLDEGHIIKNGKTKLSRAIRLLNAKHRLILSGTPIQNNVTELWSLFDFLMPGFLGSERQFSSKYAKPILQSRDVKCSARELEAGALAMESLHRQVLPFILRRLKQDVLDDLPPKIIQDYYCELSPLQHKLYEDFTKSKLCKDVTKKSICDLNDDQSETRQDIRSSSKNHIFQALQYLKNVCNHPKLVLTSKHPQYQEIKKQLDSEKSSIDDITHSSKLTALKQLLIDCGIGVAGQPSSDEQQSSLALESVVNQHRALIFCQIRSMVDIIENDLLKKHLQGITYLKLDGSVVPNQRQSVVSKFNNDPSIDILLLTTSVGGLGLNLTGADTVIFVEHDWNPTKDLQAMDRAHRIGQKKVVNVYRLITKGTLEEKIMSLQKFKTMVSNTVINQDNAGLGTMNVDQLFDLFEDSTAIDKSSTNDHGQDQSGEKIKSKSAPFIDMLPELWDQQQYETEYDLSNFVSSLKD